MIISDREIADIVRALFHTAKNNSITVSELKSLVNNRLYNFAIEHPECAKIIYTKEEMKKLNIYMEHEFYEILK